MRLFIYVIVLFTTSSKHVKDVTTNLTKTEARDGHFKHFWQSTGFCPLAPRNNVSDYFLSNDEKMNLVLIGALPNKAIKYVRIHWLLDMITISSITDDNIFQYNFQKLDELIEWLYLQGLRPGFELMGNPSSYFSNFLDPVQKENWQLLIRDMVSRYIDRFGIRYVSKWRFETWNEPDLKQYNILNFTLTGYLNYVDACAKGLSEAGKLAGHNVKFRLGGPAGLFKSPDKHPLCWGQISQCNNESTTCPLSYISFHKKGNETTSGVLDKGLELTQYIYSNFPKLKGIPIANTEADILTGWSKNKHWRGDVRYAAMMTRVIIEHYNEFIYKRKIDIEVLSNDNAFLNYDPFYFTQRTLLTRFQMNNTNPPHIQFFKKPVYVAMGLLSFLGNILDKQRKSLNDSNLMVSIDTTSMKRNEYTSLYIYVNDTEESMDIYNLNVVKEYPYGEYKYVVYLLDNVKTNPYAEWQDNASPVFPYQDLRQDMRNIEGPYRLFNPTNIDNNSLNIWLKLILPSVVLIHTCAKSEEHPGQATKLRIYNVTRNEVIITWDDRKVKTKCIRTYEVEFQLNKMDNEVSDQLFRRVNSDDVIFLWYQYVATEWQDSQEGTTGLYRVRAVDYWDRPGPYSDFARFPS